MDNKFTSLLEQQRTFFRSGRTHDTAFRIEQLKTLKNVIHQKEDSILGALHSDMRKPRFEAYASEIAFLYDEIKFAIRHLRSWAKPLRVRTPWVHWFASSWVYSDPRGVCLIIGPWNYPFQLLISPLVGAIAAGNCIVLKPSELAPHTSRVVAELIGDNFSPSYVAVVEGGVEVNQAILKEHFEYIFFTGGTAIGKIVMEAAAKHLTPVTLELGGKSPCIVDDHIHLEFTARRITWGKFFNAGQTCVAPDYLLVHRSVKPALVETIGKTIESFFGKDPRESPDYSRIVNDRHFKRLLDYLKGGKIAYGGMANAEDRYLAPTIVEGVSLGDKIMEDEIFGPILPVLEYDSLDEAIEIVRKRPNPLALYFFSTNSAHQRKILESLPFGGGCINDTLVHLSNPRLPFGGVGESGLGAYHGRYCFDTFSHKKSVVRKSFALDIKFRYPPYGDRLTLLRRLLGP